MKPGPPIARLLAAMILAIVVWAVPSTGQAHDGHYHDGRHAAGLRHEHNPVRATAAPDLNGPVALTPSAAPVVRIAPASLLPDDADRADRMAAEGLCCCGAACCAPGILAAGVTLPEPGPGRVRLRPADASDCASLGPASLSEPPRPLA